jgi:TM2 domain-containing membrane protein YozV
MTTPTNDDIPLSILKQLPDSLLRKIGAMDDAVRLDFVEEFRKRRKSLGLAFVLLGAGFHRVYLGQIWLTLLFLATFGGFFAWWIIDLLRLPGIVKEKNRSIAIGVLRDLQVLN